MDKLVKWLENLLRAQKKSRAWRTFVSCLAAIVVFTTTYSLILPAITVEHSATEDVGGLVLDEADPGSTGAEAEAPGEVVTVDADNETENKTTQSAASQTETAQTSESKAAVAEEVREPVNGEVQTIGDKRVMTLTGEDFDVVVSGDLSVGVSDRTVLSVRGIPDAEVVKSFSDRISDELLKIFVDKKTTEILYQLVFTDENLVEYTPAGYFDVQFIFHNNTVSHTGEKIYAAIYDYLTDEMVLAEKNGDAYETPVIALDEYGIIKGITLKGMHFDEYSDIITLVAGQVNEELKLAAEKAANGTATESKAGNGSKPAESKAESGKESAESKTEKTESTGTKTDSADSKSEGPSAKAETSKESETGKGGTLTARGSDYTVTLAYGAEAKIPANAALEVTEIENGTKAYKKYLKQAKAAMGLDEDQELPKEQARFFDIKIMADGKEVQPSANVNVNITYDQPVVEAEPYVETKVDASAVHFGKEGTEVVEVSDVDARHVEFEAEAFSVYGVIYTVDFHYGVDGKTYEYSLAGGDSISLRDLILSLHILDEDSKDNTAEWDQGYSEESIAQNAEESTGETVAENTDEESAETTVENTVEDPVVTTEENSEDQETQRAQEFIDNIDQVSFSDESLVKVVKIEEDITAGELKKSLNLEPEYSADLTAEQIEQLNARQFSAVDWALISMKAFNTEETLTITMLSGEVFEIKVTDLQFKKYVISASGDTFEVTVSYGDDANIPADAELKVKEILPKDTRYSELIEKSEEELDKVTVGKRNMVLFEIAVMVNGVEVEPAEGSTVNVEIVSKDADLLPDVVAKDETAVQATGDINATQDEVLMTDDSNSLVLVNGVPVSGPEEIKAVQVVHHKNNGESEAVQNITTSSDEDSVKASFRTESLSNWLLSTDRADTTPGEVTIKVGDTITLRPIGSWDRKDALGDQGFDGLAVDNWESPVDSSVMRFEAFTKTDSQDTRNNVERKYQYYTGTALNPGSITLKTKDDKQLIVHVEQGGPSAKPGTVDTVDNNKEGITFNLFDYDIPGGLDYYRNMGYNSSTPAGGVSDCYIRNETVNQLTGLKFLGWGYAGSASGVSRENWYQAQTPTQGIVQDDLSGGYPVMNGGGNLSPLFNTNSNNDAVTAYPNANGLFQKDSNGYYYYNSNTNYAEYNKGSNSFTVYESTYTQASGNAYDKDKKATKDNSNKNGKPIGFFPFHEYDSNNDLQVNLNKELNHHFGIDMSVDFVIPSSGYDANGNPIIFEFSGDDDLWVFIDGKLVLDIGGIHQPLTGKINFSEKTVEVEGISGTEPFDIVEDDLVSHKMQVFYIERGGCDSNLNIRFNLPILKPIEVEKKLEGETSSAYTDQEFNFKLFVQKSTKGEDANTYTPYVGNYKIYDAQGRQVGDEKHTSDGTFKLKDGQHIETDQRLDTLKYYVEESGVDYKYFGTTKIDNLDTPGQVAPKTYDDTSYSVTSAKTVIRDDSDVVFTNIPVTGNIKLIKKDAERKNTLKGAVFELTKKDDTSFGKKVYTTNAAGKLMNGNDCIDDLNLMPGEYILTETQAPDGYLQIEPITFKIEGAKDPDNTKFKVNVTTTNETIQSTFNMETGEFIVPNTSGVVLPATGGPGTRLFTILGSILIFGAGLVWMRKRRRAEFRTE